MRHWTLSAKTASLAMLAAVAFLSGCEKRSRTQNSSGSSNLFEEGATATTNVYRFVGVEQSLTDARKAVQEERWDQAIAATDALLKQQPGNSEAKQINSQARLELPNQTRFNEFSKAAAANEVGAAIRQFKAIAETSAYKTRASDTFEKMKNPFIENQIADEKALVRAGRCDDARRVARTTGDWFPEARPRLDDAASNCRPARNPAATAANEKDQEKPAEVASAKEPEKPSLAPAPAAAPAPIAMAADVKKPLEDTKPAEPRALAAAVPVSTQLASASVSPPSGAAPAPAPAPAMVAIRNVPMSELEALRSGGDKAPSLPAGAKMIAHRDQVKRITVALKLCVSDHGVPTSVGFVKSSDYADANDHIMSEVRKWRFRPYISGGQAVPVCTAALLNYQIE